MKLKRQNLLPSVETDICPSNSQVGKCPPILEYRDKEIRDKSIERGTERTPMWSIGKRRTTYIVRVHFSKTSKETMSDKIKRMLKNEMQQV